MQHFWTNELGEAPKLTPLLYSVIIILLGLSFWLAIKFYKNKYFVKVFKWIQWVQFTSLYIWYIFCQQSFDDSLPIYHCRLAILSILLLPNKTKLKQYFALVGTSGAVFALSYPIFDPYTFPHVTFFSYLIGHYALLINSVMYLLRYYDASLLDWKQICVYTLFINAFLVVVNHFTGGNYGVLNHTPFIPQAPLLLRFIIVSVVLLVAQLIVNKCLKMVKGDKYVDPTLEY